MPSQPVIDTLLAAYGWTGKPAAHIVNMPGYPLADIANKTTLWHNLNANLWRYARANNWVWIDTAGNNGSTSHSGPIAPGKPPAIPGAGTGGIPLLDGTNLAKSCNCGIFNTVARQLAWHILGFKDNEVLNASTDKTFVTLPGSSTFYAAWMGNVRTVTQDFATIQALKFTNHSFSKGPDGNFTDATCNVPSFANKTDIMWFDLKRAKSTLLVENSGQAGWLVVDTVYSHHGHLPAGGPPYYLIASAQLKAKKGLFPLGGPGLTQAAINAVPDQCATCVAWPNWWLLSANDLPVEFKNWARYFLPIPGYSSGY